MAGITGRLYQQFALTIAISVLISAFNALTLSPALARCCCGRAARGARPLGRLGAGFNRCVRRARPTATCRINRASRAQARRSRWCCSLGVGGAVGGCVGRKLPSGFVPDEDQGYAIIGVQLPDAASLQRTKAVFKQGRGDPRAAPRASAPTTRVAGFSFFTRTAASYVGTGFIGLKPWDERERARADGARRSSQKLNAQFAQHPRGARVRARAAGHPRHQRGGRLQHDAAGSQRRHRRVPGRRTSKQFVAAARKRPELQNVRPNFSPVGAAALRRRRQGEGAEAGRRRSPTSTARCRRSWAASYVNDFTRFGAAVARVRAGRARVPREPRRHEAVLRAQRTRRDGAAVGARQRARARRGPEYTVRFNLFRSAEITARPRPATARARRSTALEEVAARRCRRAWATPGTRCRTRRRSRRAARQGARAVADLRVPDPGGAVRELVAAVQRALRTPVAVLGAFLGLLARQVRQQRLRADRPGHAGRADGEERDPDRRVRQGASSSAGRPLVEAALEGARLRLRPILMTSFAFIFGCLPLWGAAGAGAAARRMLGTTVVTGMLGGDAARHLLHARAVRVRGATGGSTGRASGRTPNRRPGRGEPVHLAPPVAAEPTTTAAASFDPWSKVTKPFTCAVEPLFGSRRRIQPRHASALRHQRARAASDRWRRAMPARSVKVTWQEALARALARNPSAVVASRRSSAPPALVQEARAGWLPMLSANGSSTCASLRLRTSGGVVTTPINSWNGKLAVTVPLLAPLAWANDVHAQDNREVARAIGRGRPTSARDRGRAHLPDGAAAAQQLEVAVRARETAAAHYDYAHTRLKRRALATASTTRAPSRSCAATRPAQERPDGAGARPERAGDPALGGGPGRRRGRRDAGRGARRRRRSRRDARAAPHRRAGAGGAADRGRRTCAATSGPTTRRRCWRRRGASGRPPTVIQPEAAGRPSWCCRSRSSTAASATASARSGRPTTTKRSAQLDGLLPPGERRGAHRVRRRPQRRREPRRRRAPRPPPPHRGKAGRQVLSRRRQHQPRGDRRRAPRPATPIHRSRWPRTPPARRGWICCWRPARFP